MMKRIAFAIFLLLPVALTGCNVEAITGNSQADKLTGVWTVVKFGGKDLPKDWEMSFEFTKDGNLIRITADDEEETREESDFKFDGSKITYGRVGKKRDDTLTIKKLEGDDLIVHDDAKKVELQLKRIK